VHRHLAAAAASVPGLTFHDLYQAYPDFDVDVPREQALLSAHDLVVLQHPMFWYSTPALVKQWEDLVLEHGWAYGTGGEALRGKRLLSVITTGGREAAYRPQGHNRHTIRQFFSPLEQTARLCGMDYLPPFVVHGTHRLAEGEILAAAASYKRLLEALRDDRVDLEAASAHEVLPPDLAGIVRA